MWTLHHIWPHSDPQNDYKKLARINTWFLPCLHVHLPLPSEGKIRFAWYVTYCSCHIWIALESQPNSSLTNYHWLSPFLHGTGLGQTFVELSSHSVLQTNTATWLHRKLSQWDRIVTIRNCSGDTSVPIPVQQPLTKGDQAIISYERVQLWLVPVWLCWDYSPGRVSWQGWLAAFKLGPFHCIALLVLSSARYSALFSLMWSINGGR